MVDSLHIGKLT